MREMRKIRLSPERRIRNRWLCDTIVDRLSSSAIETGTLADTHECELNSTALVLNVLLRSACRPE